MSEKGSPVNILKDKDFEKSRKVLAAKSESLIHERGKGNKPQAATALEDKEEDALFKIGEFGDSNPVSLQGTVWWLMSVHFGFGVRDESRKLCLGDVQLQQDKDSEEMLVWLAECWTKTHHGQEKGHQRAFQPKVYATKTKRCPVKFYKKFKSHRPVEMNQPESPFYLAVRVEQKLPRLSLVHEVPSWKERDRKIPIHGGPKCWSSQGGKTSYQPFGS